MADALKRFSVVMHRTTHKVMAKLGKAEDTHDPEYKFALERCMNDGKKIKLLAEHTEKLIELLHTQTVIMGEIADEFKGVYTDPAGPGAAPLAQYATAVQEAEAARASMDQELRANFVAPLQEYYAQYKEIKRRAKVLSTRKVDMDRYHERVLKLTEKTTGSKDGLPQADAKYRGARDGYEMLRNEMMGDIPKLHDDLAPFIAPAIAAFCRELGKFGGAYGDVTRPLTASVARIETSVLHGWPQVITPPERTVAGIPSGGDASAVNAAAAASPDAGLGLGMPPASGPGCPPASPPSQYGAPALPPTPGGYGAPPQPAYTSPSQGYAPPPQAYAPPPQQQTYAPPPQQQPYGGPPPLAQAPPGGARALPAPARALPAPSARPPPSAPAAPAKPQARALYNFNAEDVTELSFKKGDLINVLGKQGEWWEGELGGRRGLFPANYVSQV